MGPSVRPDELDTARRDLAEWSQPILVDLLNDHYTAWLGSGHKAMRVLTYSHARMWRVLLCGSEASLQESRREILSFARLAGLDPANIEGMDQTILDELMDVVMARFMRSPALASTYCRFLLHAAARLASLHLAPA